MHRTSTSRLPHHITLESLSSWPAFRSVDVWSIGITFVELITGVPPYYDTSPEGLLRITDPGQGFLPSDLPDVSRAPIFCDPQTECR